MTDYEYEIPSNYPKYQYSIFLKNKRDEQLVIRVDTWSEFKKAKENVNKILDKVETKDEDPEWIKDTKVEGLKCEECGGDTEYKTGKTDGRPWKAHFCLTDKSHKPKWL